MRLGFCSLASGSSGNCYLIKNEKTNILLDAGISCRAIQEGLQRLGLSLKDIDAILITHDHIDHVKGLKTLIKKTACCVIASEGTWKALVRKGYCVSSDKAVSVGRAENLDIGSPDRIAVKPFCLSHDTDEPLSYTFESGGVKAAVVTDTGYVSKEIFDNIKDADILAIEANHERNILLYGSYPYPLKLRILSDVGHLSNEACAHALCEILKKGRRHSGAVPEILLAHLSKENNTPEQAYLTVKNTLEDEDLIVGKDLKIKVLNRDRMSELIAL